MKLTRPAVLYVNKQQVELPVGEDVTAETVGKTNFDFLKLEGYFGVQKPESDVIEVDSEVSIQTALDAASAPVAGPKAGKAAKAAEAKPEAAAETKAETKTEEAPAKPAFPAAPKA